MPQVDELDTEELAQFFAPLNEAGYLSEVDWNRLYEVVTSFPSESALRSYLSPVLEGSASGAELLEVIEALRDAADRSSDDQVAKGVIDEWMAFVDADQQSTETEEYYDETPPVRLWQNGFDEYSDDNGYTFYPTVNNQPQPVDGDYAWDRDNNEWVPYTPLAAKPLAQQVRSMDVQNTKVQLFWGDGGHLAKMALSRRELQERLMAAIPDIVVAFQALEEQFAKDRKNPFIVPVLRDLEVGLVYDTQDLFDNFGRAFGTFAWMFNGQIPGDYLVESNKRVVRDNLSDLDARVDFVKVGPEIVFDDGWGERAKVAALARLFGGPTGTVQRTTTKIGPIKRAALRITAPDADVWAAVKAALRATGTDKEII